MESLPPKPVAPPNTVGESGPVKPERPSGAVVRNRRLFAVLVLVLALVSAAVAVTAKMRWPSATKTDREIVGFVLNYQGTWVRQNAKNQSLEFGTELSEGDILVPDSTQAWIEICLFSGKAKRIEAAKIPGQAELSAEPESQVSWGKKLWRGAHHRLPPGGCCGDQSGSRGTERHPG